MGLKANGGSEHERLHASHFCGDTVRDRACRRTGNGTEENGPGATDTEIKIGNIMPYTGLFSEYGAIERAEAAYFQMINDRGGVPGCAWHARCRDI